ncbi:uncharacterized protein METZ01_LOCUS481849, partial [marine metagenome]
LSWHHKNKLSEDEVASFYAILRGEN